MVPELLFPIPWTHLSQSRKPRETGMAGEAVPASPSAFPLKYTRVPATVLLVQKPPRPQPHRAGGGQAPQVVWGPGRTVILSWPLYTARAALGEGVLSLPPSTCPHPTPRAVIHCLRALLGGRDTCSYSGLCIPYLGGSPWKAGSRVQAAKKAGQGGFPEQHPVSSSPIPLMPPPTPLPPTFQPKNGSNSRHGGILSTNACLPASIHLARGCATWCQSREGTGALGEPWVSRDRDANCASWCTPW